MIIHVTQPIFFVNRKNPQEIKYLPQDAPESEIPQWKGMIVETYQQGCPDPKEGEILYLYTKYRGCYLKIEKEQGSVNTQQPPFFQHPDTPAQKSHPSTPIQRL